MDPLSVTSVVGATLTLGLQVSDSLATFNRRHKDDDDFGRLAIQVGYVLEILKTLKELSIDRENSDRRQDWSIFKNILQYHDNVLDMIARDMQEISLFLQNSIGRPHSRFGILNFYWRSPGQRRKINDFRTRLERSTLALESYLNVINVRTLQSIGFGNRTFSEVGALKWLSSSDPEATQIDLRDRRLSSSGAWLLDDEKYERWLGLSPSDKILWLPGLPGTGKTYLASFIVDNLLRRYRGHRKPVTYFYCDYRQQSNHSSAYILSSLLKQLLSNVHPLPQSLMDLFTSYQHGTDSLVQPRLEDVHKEFLNISQMFPKVFVVVDALDESDSTYRADFLRMILNLDSSIRILITSRREEDIEGVLDRYPQIIPSTHSLKTDIETYIGAFIQRTELSRVLDGSGKKHNEREQTLKDLVGEVYSKSQGSFLLANLQMQRISKLSSLQEIREELSNLPQTLFGMYTQTLEKISKRPLALQKQTTKILSWIFRARRPLLVRELQQALATSIGNTNGIGQQYPITSVMVDWCLGLVTVDEERSTIRFVHFSVKEFLQEGPFILDNESTIATTCLTFLNIENFASGQCSNDKELEDRLQEFPFLDYAARYWAIHGKDCSEPRFEELAVKFLCSEHHLACATEVADRTRTCDGYDRIFPRKLSGLHVAASYGLVQLIDVFLQQSKVRLDIKDDHGQTAMLYAAKQGHTPVVELLSQKGAQIDVRDNIHLRSALSWATLNGHTSVVKWLISQNGKVNINSFDYQHSTPLHLAFERHHYDVVDILVAQGASLNLVDQWQRTQAQLAFSGSSPVDLSDYVKDKTRSRTIAQGGQARVSVFRKHGGSVSSNDPYTVLFRKAFDTTGDEGSETLRLLVQERDYLRNLHHPNIVKFIAYEENDDHSKAYLWTEYCNGGDLSKFVRKDFGNGRVIEPQRKFTKREVWRIFADLAAAMSYLHYGVIKENNSFSLKTDWRPFLHRDIKPANVVILDSKADVPTYKLCDLGIAKIWDPTMNQTRRGRGTTAYMPKEVKEQLKPWTVKGDIYSIGKTIHDLAKDFDDTTLANLLSQCMEDSPSKRPSSLTLLQIAREELAAAEQKKVPLFLPERPVEMDYVLQAIFELLERLFHSFKAIKKDLRKHLTEKLDGLLEDGKLRSADCWGLDKCLALLLVLGREDKAEVLVLDKKAKWDCPWNMYGLTPRDIAAYDGLSLLNLLNTSSSNGTPNI